MADNHELDDLDSILNSIGTSADSPTDDISLDDLLGQLRVEFPEDFGTAAASRKARDELSQAEASAQEETPVRRTPGKRPAPRSRDETPPPADSPKGSGFLDAVSRNHKAINLALCIIALLLIAGIAAVFFLQMNSDPYGGNILKNVRIAGVDVGGMSKQEAIAAISSNVGSIYDSSDMIVDLGGVEITLAASRTQPRLNAAQAAENAYAYARSGSVSQRQREYQQTQQSAVDVPLGNSLTLNTDYIRSVISDYLSGISSDLVPSGYTLEGTRPGLDADSFDEAAPCQNLLLTIGAPGGGYDMDGILSSIMDAYSRRSFHAVVPSEYLPEQPEPLDIDAIYNELHVNAVEAVEGSNGQEGTPGSCGYTFPLEEARQQLSSAHYGDVITIPMEYIVPEKLDCNGNFLYALAACTTPISSNEDYNQNMRLLCEQLNGTTLEAGASFSFNAALDAQTEQNGFRNAPAHGDQCQEETVGGGVDQVATTLYTAAMTSGMQLTEHHIAPHAYSFATRGTEISVGGWKDLKFRNPLKCSVLIRAKVTDSKVIIRFLSEEEADYEIKLEVTQVSVTPPSTVRVQKNVSDGYTEQQVLTEGIEGGQFSISWVTYQKGTDTVTGKTSEFLTLPALSRAIVSLKK